MIGGNFVHDFGTRARQRLLDHVQAAFAEVVVDIDDRQVFHLGLIADVATNLGHGRGLGEAGAEDVGVALHRDRSAFAARPVRDLGFLAFFHAHEDRAGEHRAKNSECFVINGFFGQRQGHAGVGGGVVDRELKLLAHDAASGIDFFNSQLHAVFEVRARSSACTGEFNDGGKFDGILSKTATSRHQYCA